MVPAFERPFVLTIGDRAILAFGARSNAEALELTREDWLRDDLRRLTSSDARLWDGATKLAIRAASADEAALLASAVTQAADDCDLVLAYLVELDTH